MTPNPMNMQMMGLMTGPPDVQAGASDLFQRMELAKMLRQNAMEPIKADQYASAGGGQYAAPQQIVKVGWGQGLAKLGQGLLAGMQGQKDRDELNALSEKLRGAQTGEMERLFGAPEQESGQMYPAGGNPDEVGGMGYKPATSGVPQKDLARALAGSWMPEFQKTGLEMLTKPPVKEQRTVVPAGSVVLDAEGKPVFTAPEKTQFESASPLEKEYEYAKAQGYKGSLLDWTKAKAASTRIVNQAPMQSERVIGPDGKPILVSREEAIRNRMTPATLDAATQGGIAEAKRPEKQAKPLPSPTANKLLENQRNLRTAEQALALIEGKSVGGMKGAKEATGWKGYLPEAILQRTDPEGVATRATIADLGSMKIHDRSGAAVTASEFPRLRPFVPLVTDDPATVKKKLSRFVQEYKDVVKDTENFFTASGYNVPTEVLTPSGAGKSAREEADKILGL